METFKCAMAWLLGILFCLCVWALVGKTVMETVQMF